MERSKMAATAVFKNNILQCQTAWIFEVKKMDQQAAAGNFRKKGEQLPCVVSLPTP